MHDLSKDGVTMDLSEIIRRTLEGIDDASTVIVGSIVFIAIFVVPTFKFSGEFIKMIMSLRNGMPFDEIKKPFLQITFGLIVFMPIAILGIYALTIFLLQEIGLYPQ